MKEGSKTAGGYRRATRRALAVALLVGFLGTGARPASGADDFQRPPIDYATAPASNAVSRLQERLDAGQAHLVYEKHFGYLRSVLRELRVPESSQMLVFSKTSLQRQRIAPQTPRSLYFNDDVYVGFCQGGEVMEVSAVDPQLGTMFYTVEQERGSKPHLQRQGDNCLICHGSSQTHGIPGHLVRSVFADGQGYPILASGTYRIDHTSPLQHRWGGWYVTGTHGDQTHLGNLIVRGKQVREPVDNPAGMNVTDLGDRIDCSAYLTPYSDIVALMVLEHQTEAHNLLTQASMQTRQALYQEAALNKELGQPANQRWDSTTRRIKSVGEPLVQYLLFSGEAELTTRVRGTSAFAAEFASQGPRDRQGRSLRDFDLEHRLFKYPCSYLIYSASFDALPAAVRDYVLQRLWGVLNGRDADKEFAHLKPEDRQTILEILVATKPNLPDYWRQHALGGKP